MSIPSRSNAYLQREFGDQHPSLVVFVVMMMTVVAMAIAVFGVHDDFTVLAPMRMIGLGTHPAAGERSREARGQNSSNRKGNSHHLVLAGQRCKPRATRAALEAPPRPSENTSNYAPTVTKC